MWRMPVVCGPTCQLLNFSSCLCYSKSRYKVVKGATTSVFSAGNKTPMSFLFRQHWTRHSLLGLESIVVSCFGSDYSSIFLKSLARRCSGERTWCNPWLFCAFRRVLNVLWRPPLSVRVPLSLGHRATERSIVKSKKWSSYTVIVFFCASRGQELKTWTRIVSCLFCEIGWCLDLMSDARTSLLSCSIIVRCCEV